MTVRQRIARFLAPIDTRSLETIGTALHRAIDENTMMRAQLAESRSRHKEIAGELQESAAMAYGRWMPGDRSGSMVVSESAPRVLKERLWELELALEDRGWQQQFAQAQTEFSRWGIQQIILMCRLYRLKNPLVSRGVSVSAYYVFGRGVEISSDDGTANDDLQSFLDRNHKELGQVGLTEKERTRLTDGNVFFVLFTDPADGIVIVRTIDSIEIEEIICDPNDSSVPWFYHRRWIEQQFNVDNGVVAQVGREAWYLDVNYEGQVPAQIKGKPVMKDLTGNPVVIAHGKSGGLANWQFGCPPIYPAIDWARAYNGYLEDWATRQRALARFAWDVETKGGAPALAALKATFETTLANGGYGIETNPSPVGGSMFGHDLGTKAAPMKTAGSMDTPEAGRRIGLMVASALGLPETILFCDVSTGNLATATSLDDPTRRKFAGVQEWWRDVLQSLCGYQLRQSARAPKGRIREAMAKPGAKMPTVDVDFPSILDPDIPARVAAIVKAMTLDGHPAGEGIDTKAGVTLLLQELGVEDVQAVVDAMYPEATYEMDRTLEPDVTVDPITGQPIAAPNPKKAAKVSQEAASLARAIAELRRAAIKLQEQKASA